ncbi:hypothetical protein [endosymbiont GvMRE of Glomus versiforme]|uniref:hypothetical protein n=1 Tax=endosymbiont GvMRE of Glomus versiforme TaxID=2039283 RepID=UPI000EC81062|nr:hypothetical protein [endosymbiont GvMRE of Glomus versiforme]RHZ37029.1 hypothetical protein GvMRE_I2g493 [endosymbiont GvMRE of Glomus versiforme]
MVEVEALINCPNCGKSFMILNKKYEHSVFKKMEAVLKSRKDAYEKKIALFDVVKNINIDDLEPLEKERIDYLLKGRLYNELAKQSMKEYKKLTIKDFNQAK